MKGNGHATAKVKDIVHDLFDGPHATPPPSDDGPVFLGINNITEDGRMDLTDVRHINEADFARWTKRVTPRAGDIVFSYEATLNRYAIIPAGFHGCLGRRLALLRVDESKVNTRFLHFYFFSPEWRRTVSSNVITGATVDRIPLIRFPEFPVSLPPRDLQDRIADILSAYDDLIENNTKRIKILEELTRLAFSLAEADALGVVERALGDVVDEVDGVVRTGPFGSALHESDYTVEGTPVVMPKNLIDGRIDTSDIARIPEAVVEGLAQHKLLTGDIVYGRRGDIGRRAFIGRRQAGWLCGTGCLRISLPAGDRLHPRYLHEYLGKPEVVAAIAGAAVGATMPNLNTSILRAVRVQVPDSTSQKRFVEVALANDDLVEALRSANGVLRAQRDLLLPRLISGEVAFDAVG